MAMVEQPVEDSRGRHGVSEGFTPLAEVLVRGADDAAPFVSGRERRELSHRIWPMMGRHAGLVGNQDLAHLRPKTCVHWANGRFVVRAVARVS